MSNLYKLEFVALDISGKSYMSWVLDAEIHLDAMGLEDTIKDKNGASKQDHAKAMIFLCHHLDEGLKMEYLTVKDPVILWNNLKDRYDHLKMVVLPHAPEQHNGLLMKNHKSRSTGSCSFPKVNETNFHQAKRGKGRGPSRGHGRGRGRKFNHGNNNVPKNPPNHQQWKMKEQKHDTVQATNAENACYRCGGKRHWSRTCRTPMHLVELYQASLKKTEKNVEASFISEDNVDFMHLDADYFALPEGEINHVIADAFVEI
ncbi:uncharacterized protein [Nicotiana sylvestris]|uniref:uncharacterized protein n=1 Tax=Nicotiana sylvestris TaxID=4096 RepID=UPI00388CEB00